ncbi:2OG-Fe(II) oxygenase family protein [Nonomuraea sp. NPDC049480]|uniref:2OG-Fe(II) oxygenase family protein n=1 Tax=Nonomuraea sp. NPDC049480 TaxID=3364353 RepID=UPI00378B2453
MSELPVIDVAPLLTEAPHSGKRAVADAIGAACRDSGFFPVGGELTSGRPDLKEGIYFGAEKPPGPLPLHGPNLFPAQVPELRDAVLEYLDRMTALAQSVMSGVALSLGLDEDYFRTGYTADPTILFRIFHYPPAPPDDAGTWGVGEHTDYGLLTLLLQDDNGGLQVRTPRGWIEAPPVRGTFVCNLKCSHG